MRDVSWFDSACKLDLTMGETGALYAIARWTTDFTAEPERFERFLSELSPAAQQVAWGILNYPLFQSRNDEVSTLIEHMHSYAELERQKSDRQTRPASDNSSTPVS